jgi:hypothetical protein
MKSAYELKVRAECDKKIKALQDEAVKVASRVRGRELDAQREREAIITDQMERLRVHNREMKEIEVGYESQLEERGRELQALRVRHASLKDLNGALVVELDKRGIRLKLGELIDAIINRLNSGF